MNSRLLGQIDLRKLKSLASPFYFRADANQDGDRVYSRDVHPYIIAFAQYLLVSSNLPCSAKVLSTADDTAVSRVLPLGTPQRAPNIGRNLLVCS